MTARWPARARPRRACSRRARATRAEEVLAFANAHLYAKTHRLRMFVTVFYGVLDVATGELEFASAGQVRPIRVVAGEAPEYQPSRGVPLGALRNMRYERHTLRL